MRSPTGYEMVYPPNTVTYLTPLDNQEISAPLREPFYTPEHNGIRYNVHDPIDAANYLTEVHGRDIPSIKGVYDATTGYHLAMALQKEKRAAVYEDGYHENVAEHSFSLASTSVWTAMAERPDLDAGKISIMATFHDEIVESYGGDTPIFDDDKLATKEFREAAGLTLFLRDVGDSPLADLMIEYEEGKTPEARFVKGMDKVIAYQFSLATKAALHRIRQETFEEVVASALPKAIIDPTAFEKMKGVLKELGKKWSEPGWDCIPYDGDPDEIVEKHAIAVQQSGADVIDLPSALSVKTPENQQEVSAKILRFPINGLVEVVNSSDREVIEPEKLKELGVLSIDERRTKDGSSNPPTPPATPVAIIA